jgi:phosphatidylglycerophosphate synthase
MADAAVAAPRPEGAVKPIDAWWTVLVVDPIATRLAARLAHHSAFTPTRITVFAHVLAVASAVLFATDNLLAGALVFEVRFIADCTDGKVARLTGRSSRFGFVLDAFGDRVLVTANLAALAWSYEPVVAVILAAAYPLSHHLVEARDRLLEEAGVEKQLERSVRSRYGAAMARRRLYPMPVSIDAEHLALFVAPIAQWAGLEILVPVLWLVAAFFVGQCVRYGVGLLRAAAAVDAISSRPAAHR